MLDPLVQRMKDYYASFPDFEKDTDISGYFDMDYPVMANRKKILQIAYIPVARQRIYEFKLTPLPETAKAESIKIAENQLGFQLPTLLKELYLEISDGGFGLHFMGLSNGGWRDGFGDGTTAVEFYLQNFRFFQNSKKETDPLWDKLLKHRLPIGYGGCQYIYLLDCRTENGQVLRWDAAGLAEDMGWDLMAHTLREWLEKWLDGGNCHIPIIEDYRPV